MTGLHVYLPINTNCNQKCIFCNRPPRDYDPVIYSLADIKKGIARLKKNKGIVKLILTGGEPTLHPQFEEIIKIAKREGFTVELQTNGMIFGKKELISWKKAGLDIIDFAFHSHREKLSNRLRGVNFGFKKIIENIILANRQGFEVHAIHVINSLNYRYIPAFIDFVQKMRLRNFRLNLSIVSPDGWAWENRWIIPRWSEISPYLYEACRRCVKYGLQFDISEIVPLCLVKGFEDHAASTNFRLKGLNILDDNYAGGRFLDFSNPTEITEKGPQCVKCTMNPICAGFYPRLKELYGTKDYKPRRDNLRKVIARFNKR